MPMKTFTTLLLVCLSTINFAQNLPLDFESQTTTYNFTDFDGGKTSKIANPITSGINASATVIKLVKDTGAVWAGSKITLSSNIDFTTKRVFKVKVLSPVAGIKLTLKFEGASFAFQKESAPITSANVWEELTFDFSLNATNNKNNQLVFIFDLGKKGDGGANSTYLFDDVFQVAGEGEILDLPILPLTFESKKEAYPFSDFAGGETKLMANPYPDAINPSATVIRMIKNPGQTYGGSVIQMAGPIDFTNNKIVNVKVWSPVAGKKLLLKFEGSPTDYDYGAFETDAEIKTANKWEVLTFDYTSPTLFPPVNNNDNKIVFFFDFGTMGDGGANSTYYFDDITFSENGTNTQGVSFVNNPNPGGVNTSATVAKFTASGDGNVWAGCESIYGTLGKWKFDGANPTTVTVDVFKTTATPVYIKFTSTNNSGQGTVFIGNQIPSAINQWVTLTFIVDFSEAKIGTGNGTGGGGLDNADNNIGNNQIVFHVDKDARTADRIVYFDNIRFTATKMAEPIILPEPIKPPAVRAPEQPVRIASDVISIYAGNYANLAGTEIKKNWGEATIASDILVENDSVKQLLQFNYQGIVLKNPINVSAFEKLHIDFFKTDQAEIKLSILHVGGSDITKLIAVSKDGWNSFDIPLTDFVGLNKSTVHQLKLEGAPKQGSTTVYFDNLYFYKGAGTVSVSNVKNSNVNVYPNPAKSIINIEALSKISNVKILNIYGKELASINAETNTTNVNIENLLPGTYMLRVTADDKVSTSKFIKE